MIRKSRRRGRPRWSGLSRLHSDEGGQITFITVFGAVAFVALLGMVMTTGDQVALKMRMQDAADAAALSGGTWIARGLNITSAFNVMQTQLASGAVLLNALATTLELSHGPVQLQIVALEICVASGFGTAACIPLLAIAKLQEKALAAIKVPLRELANDLADCNKGLFWRIAKALEWVNSAVHLTFFVLAAAEANAVAEANDADIALLVPGPVFHGRARLDTFLLPTREVEFEAHCDPMRLGSPVRRERGYSILLGYPEREGPYTVGYDRTYWFAFALTGVIPPMSTILFPLLAEAEFRRVCGDEGQSPSTLRIPTLTKDLEECRRNGGSARWSKTLVRSRFLPDELSDPEGFFRRNRPTVTKDTTEDELDEAIGANPNIDSYESSEIVRSCNWRPPDGGSEIDVQRRLVSSDPEDYDWQYTLTEYRLLSAQYDSDQEIEPVGSPSQCSLRPKPFLLVEENDALRYLVVARRKNRSIFFRSDPGPNRPSGEVARYGLWANPVDEPPSLITYAQVEVYNGIHNDAYSQDWRVRLDQASLLEQPFDGLSDSFDVLAGFMQRLAGDKAGDAFWQFNNH